MILPPAPVATGEKTFNVSRFISLFKAEHKGLAAAITNVMEPSSQAGALGARWLLRFKTAAICKEACEKKIRIKMKAGEFNILPYSELGFYAYLVKGALSLKDEELGQGLSKKFSGSFRLYRERLPGKIDMSRFLLVFDDEPAVPKGGKVEVLKGFWVELEKGEGGICPMCKEKHLEGCRNSRVAYEWTGRGD